MDFKVVVVPFLIVVFTSTNNGDLLESIRSLWYRHPPPSTKTKGGGSSSSPSEGVSGRQFGARSGYHDGDPYMMSASQRGWGGWGWGHDDHQNLDLYSLLGGLSFASLLGATIIYLARRNTSGRRRRSADGLSYLEDDEIDFGEDEHTKGLNIVELIDSFLDSAPIFSKGGQGEAASTIYLVKQEDAHRRSHNTSGKIPLGPGIIPHTLIDSNSTDDKK